MTTIDPALLIARTPLVATILVVPDALTTVLVGTAVPMFKVRSMRQSELNNYGDYLARLYKINLALVQEQWGLVYYGYFEKM